MKAPELGDHLIMLQRADTGNVELLVTWTLDPIAQGPYKRVPALTSQELQELFLNDPEREYFLIRRSADAKPLGRFYWRAWRFGGPADGIDWELNIFLAAPMERGKGYGTSVQRLGAEYLATRQNTRSIFAFALVGNDAERRALLKAGFREEGRMPNPRYPVVLPSDPCVLFVWPSVERAAQHGAGAGGADEM
jgi:RimJ/RimL family protein N-acetyltransferase